MSCRAWPESPLQVARPPSPDIQRLLALTTIGNWSSHSVLVIVFTSASCRVLLSSCVWSLVTPQPRTRASREDNLRRASLLVGRHTGRTVELKLTGSGNFILKSVCREGR